MSQDIQARYDLVYASKTFARAAESLDLPHKRVLDLGCGYGEYMQRFGAGSVGITTTTAEVAYGKTNNIDIRFGNVELLANTILPSERFDAFWANNLFEHLLSPHAFLVHLKAFAHDQSFLVLGVPVIPALTSLVKIPKFRGALASPHINFFTKDTLAYTVERAGWRVRDIRSFACNPTFLDRVSLSLAPHVYIIAENNQDYRYPEKKVNEWKDDEHYTALRTIMEDANRSAIK